MNDELDSEEETYWETAKIFTNCEVEPEEKRYPQVKKENEIGMILDFHVKDKEYERNDEQMRRAWDNIHASSTIDNTIRVNMSSQNKRTMLKKELITKFILFSIIIGQATFAKEIGGMMVHNSIVITRQGAFWNEAYIWINGIQSETFRF